MANLPLTANELIEFLDELIPEPAPRPEQSHQALLYDAGRRSVVLQLKAMQEGSVAAPLKQKRGAGRVRS